MTSQSQPSGAKSAATDAQPSAAFTPGPWVAEQCPCGSCSAHSVFSSAEKICAKATEANARLIAAAPDLYEALKACRSKFEEYALLHYRKRTAEGDEKAFANQRMATLCDEAISKAEAK